jgi:hypothetical protein
MRFNERDSAKSRSIVIAQTTRTSESEVFGTQASALGDTNKHAGAKFLVIVEGKYEI